MNANLDQTLARLLKQPIDARLNQLEPAVWSRIGALRQAQSFSGVWGWRAALAVLMLSAGILADGAAKVKTSHEVSPFALHSALLPSTLIEGRS